ncbi:GntR family transcriptional regulator [Streptomyces sp. NPDC013489]|uniref:GntR family transcriptional regulator n=1 Tax=Streptomyces sp. NPDC013489 TaxID=3155606 RepID=UPI0033DEAC04
MTDPVPSLRHTIADDLRTQITTGHLGAGVRLPSESQLAAHYKVSTPTLRTALALLHAEGLIEKIHGKGNYVRRPFSRLTYASGILTPARPSLRVTVRTTQLRARGALTSLLKVPSRTPLTEFLCIGYEGESPHSLVRIYVPRDLVTAEPPWCRQRPAQVRDKVTARLATTEEASTLRVTPARAVLAITRVSTDTVGRVIEAAHLVLLGDRADALFTTYHTTEEGVAEE